MYYECKLCHQFLSGVLSYRLSNHIDNYITSHRKPKHSISSSQSDYLRNKYLLVLSMSWFSYVSHALVFIRLPSVILEFLLGSLSISHLSFTLVVSQCQALFWHCAVQKVTDSYPYGEKRKWRKELRGKMSTQTPHTDSQHTGHCQISQHKWHSATSPTLKFNTHLLFFPPANTQWKKTDSSRVFIRCRQWWIDHWLLHQKVRDGNVYMLACSDSEKHLGQAM